MSSSTGSNDSLGAGNAGANSSEIAAQARAKHLADVRKRCRTDKLFLGQILGYDFQEDVHRDLFEQYIPYDNSKPLFDQHDIKRRLILWSRGFYKTTSAVVEAIQLILNFPDISIMLMQAKIANGKELLAEVKSHFNGTNPRCKLGEYFPEFCGNEDMGTAMSFNIPNRPRVRRDPTVFVASPKAAKAGLHPDVGFFDDLVNEINYKNPELMKKVIKDFSHYTPLINPGGFFFVTGTRYTFGDLYEHIIREEATRIAEGKSKRWIITIRGCWNEDANGNRVGGSNFPPRKLADGRTIGISLEELLAIQQEDPETFAAQYLNRPIAAGTQEFTELMLLGAVRPKENLPAVGPAILFIDLAEGKDYRADNRTIVCGRQIGGVPTVCDLRSGKWGTLDIATNVLEMALAHRPLRVFVEGSPGSTFFIDYLKMIAKDKGIYLQVERTKMSNNKGAKNLRISAIAGAIKTGRLKFLPGLPGWAALVQQFIEFPKGQHDDEIDTIGFMVQFYSGQIATFDLAQEPNLPFFLRQPGVDFSFEKQITATDDGTSLFVTPEPIF